MYFYKNIKRGCQRLFLMYHEQNLIKGINVKPNYKLLITMRLKFILNLWMFLFLSTNLFSQKTAVKVACIRKQYNLWSIHCQSRSKLLSGTTASLFRWWLWGQKLWGIGQNPSYSRRLSFCLNERVHWITKFSTGYCIDKIGN